MSQLPSLPRIPERLGDYDRAPEHAQLVADRDLRVPMRDGVELCIDLYRPAAAGRFPALLAFSIYNKDLQAPDIADAHRRLSRGQAHCPDVKLVITRGSNCKSIGRSR